MTTSQMSSNFHQFSAVTPGCGPNPTEWHAPARRRHARRPLLGRRFSGNDAELVIANSQIAGFKNAG